MGIKANNNFWTKYESVHKYTTLDHLLSHYPFSFGVRRGTTCMVAILSQGCGYTTHSLIKSVLLIKCVISVIYFSFLNCIF